jgi:diadenosine tetraphosphatase ApaH/serine/threonine PP2A family protein phosphatase
VIGGNHDAVVAGKDNVAALGELGSPAVMGAITAIEAIEASGDVPWLRSLPSTAARHGVECVHGSLADPLWGYVDGPAAAGACLEQQRERLLLVGHTHQPAAFWRADGTAAVVAVPAVGEVPLVSRAAVLNPGSLGCPQRDGAPPGSWLLLDLDRQRASWHRATVP